MLTARMRAVSGEKRRRRCLRAKPAAARVASAAAGRGAVPASAALSTVAVAISDAIERLDLGEFPVGYFELLAQPLDVAVDRAIVDIDVLAVSGVHQLIAALDVAGPHRQRFQNEEFGDGQLDVLAAPSA